MIISFIVAYSKPNQVMGIQNKLPWHLPEDLKRFKEITLNHNIIMGRKTFESIGRVLPKRKNIVLSRNTYQSENSNLFWVKSIEEALDIPSLNKEVFIIGGADLFKQCFPLVKKMYLTEINHHFDGDTFFPEFSANEFKIVNEKSFQDPFSYKFIDMVKR